MQRNIFSMLATKSNGYILQRRITLLMSFCNLGPEQRVSFKEIPKLVFWEALKTTLKVPSHVAVKAKTM